MLLGVVLILIGLFVYAWVGYPCLLYLWCRMRGGRRTAPAVPSSRGCPTVSVIIAARNEERDIEAKLGNTLALDYPPDRLEIIVVSDGSTDGTVQKARRFAGDRLTVLDLSPNRGKSTAQNHAVERARGDIVLFTDVGSRLEKDFIRESIPFFDAPDVACVGGRVFLRTQDGQLARSQRLYWRVEQFVREAESELGMLHSMPGWGFAVRRRDFVPLDPETGDDMILPMDMALRGKRSLIAPRAVVSDHVPPGVRGELKARQRITVRNLTGLMKRRALLMPWKYPRRAFSLWSHRLLRWLSPLLMLGALAGSAWLYLVSEGAVYEFLLLGQLVGYTVGLVGILGSTMGLRMPIVGHVAAFLIANLGFLIGLAKFVGGHKIHSYR